MQYWCMYFLFFLSRPTLLSLKLSLPVYSSTTGQAMGRQQFIGAALAFLAAAQGVSAKSEHPVQLLGQCGGSGYRGPTRCGGNDANTSPDICKPRTPTATTLTTSTVSATPTSSAVPAPREKYLITFGDSYSQTGFDISSTKPSVGNPLGNPPLPGWTASGGLNWVGFLASQFNTSNLLAYNFAYGGATTNASLVTPWREDVLSLIDQVAQFSTSIASKPAYAPWTAETALFGVWIGVNDVGNSWWKEEYDALVESIMDSYFGRLQVLYDAGARSFVLLSVPRKFVLLFPCSFDRRKGRNTNQRNSNLPYPCPDCSR